MKKLATIIVAFLGMAVPAASAEEILASFTPGTGAAERIESGDFLRVYSQEVAAAACFFHNGVNMSLSKELLVEAQGGFAKHLDALRNGNEALGIIGAEERRKTVYKIDQVEQAWAPIDAAVTQLLQNPSDPVAIATIKDQNLPLFELTDGLLGELEKEYANPAELVQAEVLMLEIVGRQSLMTQKIAKNACKLLSGRDTGKARADLEQAVSLYELSLTALLDGMPEVGLQAAPTKEIADGLRSVIKDWKKTRPTIDSILAGSRDTGALEYLFEHMADEMHKLQEITHMYVVFSKHEY